MKKWVSLLVIACMLLALCGCNKQNHEEKSPEDVIVDSGAKESSETKKENSAKKKYLLENSGYILVREKTDLSEIKYEYDSNGRLKTYSFKDLLTGKTLVIATYRDYDSNGNPRSLYPGDGSKTTFVYDSKGNVLEMNEYSDGEISIKTTYEYDGYENLTNVRMSYFGKSAFYTDTRYEYESEYKYYTYEYNSATEQTTKTAVLCEYDSNGNLIKETKNWTSYSFGESKNETSYREYEYALKPGGVTAQKPIGTEQQDTTQSQVRSNEATQTPKVSGNQKSESVPQKQETPVEKIPELTDEERYAKAVPLYDSFIKELKQEKHWNPNQSVGSLAYQAEEELNKCNGYGDSNRLIKIIDKLNSLWKNDPNTGTFSQGFTFDKMDVSVSGENITIKKADLRPYGETITIDFHASKPGFTASITRLFDESSGYWRTGGYVQYLMSRFTDVGNATELVQVIANRENWSYSESKTSATFANTFGGYRINIQIEADGSGRMNCNISVN